MNIGFEQPWFLLLLALALLPLLRRSARALSHPCLSMLPRDRISKLTEALIVIAACGSFVAMILGISRPYLPGKVVERVGRGAQMVILLDRSRSMDGPFANAGVTNPLGSPATASKGRVARKLLSEFAARRKDDMFGMVVFSNYSIPVLGLVTSQEAVQAAIAAGDVGRGLAETDVGAGIEGALEYFEDLPYTGSRILLLVSDGAARLDLGTRVQLRNRMVRLRVSLYWIYIRSLNSTGLFGPTVGNGALEATLHQYFEGIGIPYRAYMAEDPEDIEKAISDVGRLQNLPIHFTETSPRKELWRLCYAAALIFLVPLCAAGWLEIRRWV